MVEDIPDTEMETQQVTPLVEDREDKLSVKKDLNNWAEGAIAVAGAKRRKEGSDPAQDKRDIQRLLFKLLASSPSKGFDQDRENLKRQMELAVASGNEDKMIEVMQRLSELPELKIIKDFNAPLNIAMEAKDLEGMKAALQVIQDAQIEQLPKEKVEMPVEPPQEASV